VRLSAVCVWCVIPTSLSSLFFTMKSKHHQNPKLSKKIDFVNSRPKSIKKTKTFLFKPMYQVAEAIKINKMLPSWIMIWNFYKCQIFVYCTLVCGMTMHVHVHVRLSSAPTAHWTNRTLKQALQRFLNICYLLPSHQFVYRFRRKVKQKISRV